MASDEGERPAYEDVRRWTVNPLFVLDPRVRRLLLTTLIPVLEGPANEEEEVIGKEDGEGGPGKVFML